MAGRQSPWIESSQSRVQQKVKSVKYVWKKTEIDELKTQLRNATQSLSLAIVATISYQESDPDSFSRRFPMLSIEQDF